MSMHEQMVMILDKLQKGETLENGEINFLINLYNGYFREWNLAEQALNANHANRKLMLRYKHQNK